MKLALLRTAERPVRTLDLFADHQLVVEPGVQGDLLRILGSDGGVSVSIQITSAGPVLHFEGGGLAIQTKGDLTVNAARVAIHGREGVVLSSGGDAHLCAAGDFHGQARIQNITARLGNVNIKANDDVRLNGERIRSNC
jgi:hypothetical protein